MRICQGSQSTYEYPVPFHVQRARQGALLQLVRPNYCALEINQGIGRRGGDGKCSCLDGAGAGDV